MNTQPISGSSASTHGGAHSNALSQHFRVTRADAATILRILNTLQDNGVISDNVVSIDDIAHVDALRALQWLQSNGYAH